MFTLEELEVLASEGCAGLTRADAFERRESVTSQQVSRTGEWVALMGATDRLIDMFAREYFEARLSLIPADESPISGRLAALLCRSLARRAANYGRRHTADWEAYADELTASLPTFADTFAPRWADALEASPRPSPTQVIAASVDPQGKFPWSLKLEHAGTELIRLASHDRGSRPDIWIADIGRHVTRRDPVAYSGEPRFVLPQPCRYGRNGLQPRMETGLHRRYIATPTEIAVDFFPVVEMLTTDYAWRNRENIADPVNVRRGWRGHRRIVWTVQPAGKPSVKVRAARAARKTERASTPTTANYGKAVGPWSISPRSLPVSAEKVADQVALIEGVLRTCVNGASVAFTSGVVVHVISPAQVFDDHQGRAYPIREWSRRAALAGLTVE